MYVTLYVMRMKTTDEDLALAAAGGDRDAFAVLLDRRYNDLFGLAFRLTGNRAGAEDLTQDICAALPAKLAGFRGDARFTTWLYRVAVNAAHDQRRRAKTRHRAATGWGTWEANRQADIAQEKEQVSWLNTAMNTLPDDLRDTLALLLEDQLTHAEAGAVLGVSEGTISWRMSQARKLLRVAAKEEQTS